MGITEKITKIQSTFVTFPIFCGPGMFLFLKFEFDIFLFPKLPASQHQHYSFYLLGDVLYTLKRETG